MMLSISLIVFLLGLLSLSEDIEKDRDGHSILTPVLFILAVILFFLGGIEEVRL